MMSALPIIEILDWIHTIASLGSFAPPPPPPGRYSQT